MATADTWPPTPFDVALDRFREHEAWWVGDTATLHDIYSTTSTATHVKNGQPYRGGLVGSLSKAFWGAPVPVDEKRMKMHVDLAGGICRLSATLLFGEQVKIKFAQPEEVDAAGVDPSKPKQKWVHPGQARLDLIMNSDEARAQFLQGGEYSAALGGVFFAVTWNARLADHVRLRAYAADTALPEFQDGILTAVTLWSEYRVDRDVYRLLERHDVGTITYTLHKGTDKTLGVVVPMSSLTETAHYNGLRSQAELDAAIADPLSWSETVSVATGVEKLAVVYIPNRMPNKDWRKQGVLANLGRSDLAGIEDELDKVDLVWTSLMRDVSLGQGRLTVPESWLETTKRGDGGTVDLDREVYVGVNMLGQGNESVSGQVHESQFDIRDEQLLNVIDGLKREIAWTTGYSLAHLGVASDGRMKTATEVEADYSDSERVRDEKAIHAKPALAQLAQVALAIDGVVFPGEGGKWFDELPEVDFPPVSQEDMEKAGRIIQSLFLSESISRRERVRRANPDWSEDQVDDEVDALTQEFGGPAPDPTTFTDDPTTLDGTRPPLVEP